MAPKRSFLVSGRTYLISNHAWQRVRKLDIDLGDVAKIIESPMTIERFHHKIEYTGCYCPRWVQRKGETRMLAVKIVINTRSTLTLKTVHNMGNCSEDGKPEEKSDADNL